MGQIQGCRSCGHADLVSIVDLGSTPLANALRTEDELSQEESKYPLELVMCPECTLLQITENVDPEVLFSHYMYQSSFSDAFLHHCETLADEVVQEHGLNAESLVVDIASNDGYLLQYYQKHEVPVQGIEPAKNISEIAVARDIPTKNEFFTSALADDLEQADVVHAHNVVPHVANQRDFIEGVSKILKPHGIAIIEFAYAGDTIAHTEFDQIYHEHMCYFSLTAFRSLCNQYNLDVHDVKRLPVHGGSLRVTLKHTDVCNPSCAVKDLLVEEKPWNTVEKMKQFGEKVERLKEDLLTLLKQLKEDGKSIVVYGASAKGSTLMNYFGITSDTVEYVVDRSTMKHGFYTPGTGLLIRPVEALLEDQPDYALMLTWNFKDEILAQQEQYIELGGKFIVPLPEPAIIPS